MTPVLYPFAFLLGVVVDRIGAPACRYSSSGGMDRIHESYDKVCSEKGCSLSIIKFYFLLKCIIDSNQGALYD